MQRKGIKWYGAEIYKWVLIVFTAAMFVVVGINVFSRYVLNNSLGWADELARFVFIWISFLGAVIAYRDNEHVGLDLLVSRIPSPRIQAVLRLIGEIGIFLVLSCLLYYGWIVSMSATNVSPALYIPMKVVYMIVPVCAAFMLLINLGQIAQHVQAFRHCTDKEDQLL
jgi:TRAP-type C4-dicarboxylate transport system permease small subunit